MQIIEEQAPAKLNLGLNFDPNVEKLADGRKLHKVSSPAVTLKLHNKFVFTEPKTDKIEVVINTQDPWILANMSKLTGPEGNCWKTVVFLQKQIGKNLPIRMEIEYNLPLSGGLGGSAADMAAILRGLNRFYNLKYTLNDLAKLGHSLGSDVPFCVYNYPYAHMGGTGEIIKEIKSNALQGYQIVLVLPTIDIPLSKTKSAFEAYDKNAYILPHDSINEGFSNFELMLEAGIFNIDLLCNCFLLTDIPWRNEVLEIMNALRESNNPFDYIGMAGAGPTVFGIIDPMEFCMGDLPENIKFKNKKIPLKYIKTSVLNQ
ncbi:MAG: hypothetical protein WC356_00355 [Candidatus Micrarchaeia archaeon]|jgi:4-diphosphocytidyl-2-C-methyl-D-erythritol kinase